METLLNTEFFLQIKNNNNNNIQNSYSNFMKSLFTFCKSPGDTIHAYFVLNYTRIELVSIQNRIIECKSKKK